MSRIDRARLESAAFPLQHPAATRCADVDQLGHINNLATAELFQEGRVHFLLSFGLTGLAQRSGVVAASRIEYARDVLWPHTIDVATGVLDVGRTSFRLGQTARQQDMTAAYAEIVLVMRDAAGPAPLPEASLADRARLPGTEIRTRTASL
ncbi:MAG TPA: acyl-CoA thioesterase [Candidatus Binataceae bacterium]|nr:acyl-CoA thioesterase [Candidatus Binataceae bacterium]